jgi:ankyrin repeat protein
MSRSDLMKWADSKRDGPFLRGITPLCLAAYLGKAPMVAQLLEDGVYVDSRDFNGI